LLVYLFVHINWALHSKNNWTSNDRPVVDIGSIRRPRTYFHCVPVFKASKFAPVEPDPDRECNAIRCELRFTATLDSIHFCAQRLEN